MSKFAKAREMSSADGVMEIEWSFNQPQRSAPRMQLLTGTIRSSYEGDDGPASGRAFHSNDDTDLI